MNEFEKRDWTAEQIDLSLNLQTHLPGCREKIRCFDEMSAIAAARLDVRRLHYGPTTAEYVLCICQTNVVPARPLVVFIHGGYWRALRAEDLLFLAPFVLAAGLDFASVNYGLCPDVSFPLLVSQALDAIATIARENPNRPLWVAGHSAGAHLGMIACGATWWRAAGLTSHPVRRALLISGLYDLAPVSRSFLQETLNLSPHDICRFSPIDSPADLHIEYTIAWGALETDIFKDQSAGLHRKIVRQGACSQSIIIPDADHFDVLLRDFGRSGAGASAWPFIASEECP